MKEVAPIRSRSLDRSTGAAEDRSPALVALGRSDSLVAFPPLDCFPHGFVSIVRSPAPKYSYRAQSISVWFRPIVSQLCLVVRVSGRPPLVPGESLAGY